MPVPGAKGLYGGWVKGRQDKQTYRSNEVIIEGNRIINTGNNLNNIKSQYNFQEFMSNRESRDLKQDAADMETQEFMDDAANRELSDQAQAAQDQTTIDTAETQTAKVNAMNEARQGQAENTSALKAETLRLAKVGIERSIIQALIGTQVDKVDHIAQVLGSFGHEDPETGLLKIDEEGYDYAYKQMEQVFGVEALEQLGLDPEKTEAGMEIMSALRRQAVHTVETQIKEHLMDLEQEWSLKIAQAKSTGMDMDSVIGQMSMDKMKAVMLMQSLPPGGLMHTLAQETIGYLDSAMLNLTTKEGMVSQEKTQTNFKTMLNDTFPEYATHLAQQTDLISMDKGLAESSEFIHNVFRQLNDIYTPQKAMELIAVMYEYDTSFITGNGFVMREKGDELGNLARYYEQVEEVSSNEQMALWLRGLGPESRKEFRVEILRRFKSGGLAEKAALEAGRPFVSRETD